MSVKFGAIGVQKVTAKLLEQGFLVSMPVYDDGYDLITDWKGEMRRVQVKCTAGNEDSRRTKLKFLPSKGLALGTCGNKITPKLIVILLYSTTQD